MIQPMGKVPSTLYSLRPAHALREQSSISPNQAVRRSSPESILTNHLWAWFLFPRQHRSNGKYY